MIELSQVLSFSTVDHIITLASVLEHTEAITPNVSINNRTVLQKMIRAVSTVNNLYASTAHERCV